MTKNSDSDRGAATRLARKLANHRLASVGKMSAVIIITVLATLVFAGQRIPPECIRHFICIDRGDP